MESVHSEHQQMDLFLCRDLKDDLCCGTSGRSGCAAFFHLPHMPSALTWSEAGPRCVMFAASHVPLLPSLALAIDGKSVGETGHLHLIRPWHNLFAMHCWSLLSLMLTFCVVYTTHDQYLLGFVWSPSFPSNTWFTLMMTSRGTFKMH